MYQRQIADRVRPRWRKIVPRGAQEQAADVVLEWLVAQYGQSWRAYHTLAHVERMFAVWEQAARSVPVADARSLALAIWFHDAVYDPRRRDNEEKSAEEAGLRLAPLGIDKAVLARVRRMILATATHQADGADTDTALLLDLDLEILGAEAGEYDAYSQAIRQEYAFVPEEDYRVGRAGVLRRFLERPRIYLTEPMFERYEVAARRNVAREIAALPGR